MDPTFQIVYPAPRRITAKVLEEMYVGAVRQGLVKPPFAHVPVDMATALENAGLIKLRDCPSGC